jgi:hypothetical protein
MKGFVLSAGLISLHLSALICDEDCFLMLVLTSLLSSIFTIGCHELWFLICILVSLRTHLLVVCVTFLTSCVWEGHVLHLVSHLFKTMMLLNAHPYTSLIKCFAMTHTHLFG